MQKMKAMTGNTSNLVAFSKLIIKVSKLSETHPINEYRSLNLLRSRLFSSFGDHNRSEEVIKTGRNDYDGDDDSKLSGINRGNLGNQGINPVRDDGQRSQFCGLNATEDRDFRSRERSNDGFSKPISGENGEGSGDVGFDSKNNNNNNKKKKKKTKYNYKKYYQPPVRELLNMAFIGENHGGKEGDDSLEKFKLGDGVDSTTTPKEEKMDAPQDADEIFNKMKKSGLIPNAVAMIEGLCNEGLVHEAMRLFGLMREKGTMPEVVVYTSVVEGFCQAQNIDEAKRIFKKMQDNCIVPNAFSYTVLIKGLCEAQRLEEATGLCVEMLEAGHSPNVSVFTKLVQEFCKEKGLEDAQKFILTLKQKGFFLDEKAVRVYYSTRGPTSPMVWEAIFGPKKTS